jgi:peptidoglycan hydrolase CwlO-like protein
MIMVNEILETRITHCESNVKIFANQLDDVANKIESVANRLIETEKSIVKTVVMQEFTNENIKKIEHHIKNTDAAVDMVQQQQAKIENKQAGKNDLFKSWHMWLALGIGVFGALMSIYDRIAQHLTR